MPIDDVLAELEQLRRNDLPTHGGTTTAYVFDSGIEGVDELAARAHRAVATINGLDPVQFPSVARIEREIFDIVIPVLGGDHDAVGTVTSGGTESIGLAILGARERWKARGGQGTPQMVVPTTAHGSFRKAAHLYGLEEIRVPVDPVTFRADADAMIAEIGPQTAIVGVSAPSYPYGVIDPITEVAAAAANARISCHVDACMGGWILPFLRRNGLDGPDFDLSVPGVTSLSVDMHKYGYVPKGISLLLHRDVALRQSHWFAFADWPGYSLVNPTLASTRPAGPMAAAWAVLNHLGTEGFAQLAVRARRAAEMLIDGVSTIDGLQVLGTPDSTLVAIADTGDPDGPDIRVVIDEVSSRGWFIQAQPGHNGAPPTAHATLTPAATDRIPQFIEILRDSVASAREIGRVSPDAALLQEVLEWDVATVPSDTVHAMLKRLGFNGERLPARTAEFYALIDAVPAPVAERLLSEIFAQVLSR